MLVALLGACTSGETPVTTLRFGNAVYAIPDAHILTVTEEPHQFVRIKPPERTFELVYDSRTVGRTDPFGWPMIFGLNDENAPAIDRHSREDLVVVCRRAVNPRGGCGLRVTHQGTSWAVLFPRADFGSAHAFRDQALAVLAQYQG